MERIDNLPDPTRYFLMDCASDKDGCTLKGVCNVPHQGLPSDVFRSSSCSFLTSCSDVTKAYKFAFSFAPTFRQLRLNSMQSSQSQQCFLALVTMLDVLNGIVLPVQSSLLQGQPRMEMCRAGWDSGRMPWCTYPVILRHLYKDIRTTWNAAGVILHCIRLHTLHC